MKWVMHISALHAAEGGPPRAVLSIATELTKLGENVHVVAMKMAGEVLPEPYEDARAAGVTVHLVPIRRFAPARFSLRVLLMLYRVSRGADVVSTHGFYQFTAVASWAMARGRQTRFLVQPHGVFEPYQERASTVPKRLYMRVVGHRILEDADSILVASEQERQGVIQSLPSLRTQIEIVGVGVTPRRLEPRSSDSLSFRRVLFLSRIATKKRLDLLIDACASAAKTSAAFSVDVCGTGDEQLTQAMASRAEGIPVRFHGHVQGPSREQLEMAASLFCLPSDNENFGQAVAEAMAAGIPVLTTAQTGASEHVIEADAGWVLDCPSSQELLDAITTALDDTHGLSRRSTNAMNYVGANLSWRAVATRWISVAD